MKIFIALVIAVVLGIGIGITVGWLRMVSTPWEGLPAVDSPAENEVAISGGSPAPRVVLDRQNYDFGTLDLEKTGRQEFTVANRGNAMLKLTKGETTCRSEER